MGKVWGGAALTPGAKEKMSSLRAEHCGAMGVLLILLAIQTYMQLDTAPNFSVDLWIDNAEVLASVLKTFCLKLLDHTFKKFWAFSTKILNKI